MLFVRTLRINSPQARFFCQDALPNIARVGFIGLGNMGYRMCKNLLKKGFDVTVYDTNKETVKKVASEGAHAANDAKHLVSNVDCIITMLPVGKDLLSLYTPEIVKSIKPGSLVIDSSTIEHTVSQELEKKFKPVKVSFIDAPVSGGIVGAENGTLTFMVGGETKVVERADPVLKAMGTNLYHCGSVGSGQIAKVCNNLILGITMAGLSEAMAVGVALGLDSKVLTNIINCSSGQCWSSTVYNPVPGILPNVPSSKGYKDGFSAQLILKDLGIVNEAAKSVGLPLKVGKITYDMYDTLCKNGLNEKDFSIIYQYICSQKK